MLGKRSERRNRFSFFVALYPHLERTDTHLDSQNQNSLLDCFVPCIQTSVLGL
jgi:hypothetical protein